MPHVSLIATRPHPRVLEAIFDRPELAGAVYHLRNDRFSDVPDEGLIVVDLPMSPKWRVSCQGPLWYEPNPSAYPTPPAAFCGTPKLTSPKVDLVFDTDDIGKRFPLVSGELPAPGVAQFCKYLALQCDHTIAWYNYLDRGDTLYHDVAWIFGRKRPQPVAESVVFTGDHEDEELYIYDGFSGPKWSGWRLWGNAREQSQAMRECAASAVCQRLGLSYRPGHTGPGFPYDFPAYSNVTGNYWSGYRLAPPSP